MADHPILFSAPMVRALLDGRKTQTRRILKPKRGVTLDDFCIDMGARGIGRVFALPRDKLAESKFCVGDRLWVRERIYGDRMENIFTGERTKDATVGYYFADDAEVLDPIGFNLSWLWERGSLPSIHMPRFFSRLTLIVEAVSVELLQDISTADVIAEGVSPICEDDIVDTAQTVDAFAALWESINGAGSWDANPWVAAITFRVVRANIDALADDGQPAREAAR